MASSVLSYLSDFGDEIFYKPDFINILYAHRQLILSDGNYNIHAVDPKASIRCEGNLYAYLDEMGLAKCYQLLVLFMNGYTNPIEFTRDVLTLKIPSINLIERIKDLHQTV